MKIISVRKPNYVAATKINEISHTVNGMLVSVKFFGAMPFFLYVKKCVKLTLIVYCLQYDG